MKRENIISILIKERKKKPEITSVEIAKKHRLPWFIVEAFGKRIEKTNQKKNGKS
ncbi:hypothetical protein [Peribacillus asahii]|uniref:hypothetical protein n=1 Tax=Peribacillus asahii TaxID=228899 RepID=UPI00381C72AD